MTSTSTAISLPVRDQASVTDWRALGDLIGLATERLTAPIEGTHHAITDRLFGLMGQAERPMHSAYRGLTRRFYDSVRGAGSVANGTLSVGAAAIGQMRTVPRLWSSRRGAGIQAAMNALWGDEFVRRQSDMQLKLTIRDSEGAHTGTDAESLRRAFPVPTHRLVVLLHGLGHTERCWQGVAEQDGVSIGMADVLERDGFTPVFVRYNTGMHVTHNGKELSRLLNDVVTKWPIDVHEIVLIGHSMGALMARGAVHTGRSTGSAWITRLRHVVSIAAPHHGSPIEKGVHLASQVLSRAPEGQPLSAFIDERSAGIQDMRFGTIREEGAKEPGRGTDSGEAPIVSLLEEIDHHLVAGIVTRNHRNLFGFMVGDFVVRVGSATGVGSRIEADAANVEVFTGRTHPGLLNDPAVHSQVRAWLTPSSLESDVAP